MKKNDNFQPLTNDADARADRLRDRVLAALDDLADSGDGSARHAAAIVRRERSSGRPSAADGKLLAQVAALRAQGRGREAVSIVARSVASTAREAEAIARRLRRKLNG